jgi:hypothetical protein
VVSKLLTHSAGQCRHIGDIRNPELVRASRGKVTVDEIRRRSCISISNRRYEAFSPCGTLKISLAHQTRDAAIAYADTFLAKICLQPRTPVVAARFAMEYRDLVVEHEIELASYRRHADSPTHNSRIEETSSTRQSVVTEFNGSLPVWTGR